MSIISESLSGQSRGGALPPGSDKLHTLLTLDVTIVLEGDHRGRTGALCQAIARAVLRAGASGKADFAALEQLRKVTVADPESGITACCPEE